jgi:DNA-binding transcriptional ArsR family regulator
MAARAKSAGTAARIPANDAAGREPRSGPGVGTRSGPAAAAAKPRTQTRDLDRLVHDRTRLAIVSALAANESLTFTELKGITETTDGNLSVHTRKLEDAGYISCTKGFEGRTPRTQFALTSAGRKALQKYLDHMEAIISHARKNSR